MLQKKQGINAVAIFYTVALSMLLSAHVVLADFEMPAVPAGAPENFDDAILNATNWILGFATALGVLALIWGGINYLTSAGGEEQARTGKQTIKYALLGMIIAGIAWALVNVLVNTIL